MLAPAPAQRAATGTAQLHAIAAVLLLLALALVYGRAGELGYVDFDDVDYVLRAEPVRAGLSAQGVVWAFTEFHMSNWHPLTWLSHMLDVSLFGLEPGPQHLVNVALHGANSLLVYALALALLGSWPASVLVALLFLVHPLHVESVAWIAERKDLLCALFFLLAMLAYLRYVARPGVARYLWVFGGMVLALLSKPMAVTLPVVLLLLDFWPLGRLQAQPTVLAGVRLPAWAWLVVEKVPLFALSLASAIVTVAAQAGAIASIETLPPGYRLMNSALAYVTYLRDSIAPVRLAILYPLRQIGFWDSFVPSLLVLCAISGAAIAWRRKYPWLLFGWLWFLLTLLPVIGLIQVGVQSHADRYMYLPSLGLLLALGAAFARLSRPASRKALLALAPALGFYAFLAWVQLGYWAGPYMLFTRSLELVGDTHSLHTQLAAFHLREGRIPEAEAHALKALELAPEFASMYANLGTVLLARKDAHGAESLLRMALSKSPHNAQILARLGAALEHQGRLDEARQAFAAALRADPKLAAPRGSATRLPEPLQTR